MFKNKNLPAINMRVADSQAQTPGGMVNIDQSATHIPAIENLIMGNFGMAGNQANQEIAAGSDGAHEEKESSGGVDGLDFSEILSLVAGAEGAMRGPHDSGFGGRPSNYGDLDEEEEAPSYGEPEAVESTLKRDDLDFSDVLGLADEAELSMKDSDAKEPSQTVEVEEPEKVEYGEPEAVESTLKRDDLDFSDVLGLADEAELSMKDSDAKEAPEAVEAEERKPVEYGERMAVESTLRRKK